MHDCTANGAYVLFSFGHRAVLAISVNLTRRTRQGKIATAQPQGEAGLKLQDIIPLLFQSVYFIVGVSGSRFLPISKPIPASLA